MSLNVIKLSPNELLLDIVLHMDKKSIKKSYTLKSQPNLKGFY